LAIARDIVKPENARQAQDHTVFAGETESMNLVCELLVSRRSEPDFIAPWRPGEAFRAPEKLGPDDLLSVPVQDHHIPRVFTTQGIFQKSEGIAAGGDPNRGKPTTRTFVEHFPQGEFDTEFA